MIGRFHEIASSWIPDKARTTLEYGGGLYGKELQEFREISELALFPYDDGLPGKTWAAGHPVILAKLSDSYFRRADEAKVLGLTCGVGLPVFIGEDLMAVMVLLCGDSDEKQVGAVELWHNNAEVSHELALVEGYYGAADTFEFNSRQTKFPRGYGLPGRAWKADGPVIIKDIGETRQFLRVKDAAEIGINFGLGIPYRRNASETWVVSFLSAPQTPMARRFEIWKPKPSHDALVFQSGYCSRNTDLDSAFASKTIRKGEGSIGDAWMTGTPIINDNLKSEASIAAQAALKAELNQVVVLPVFQDAQLQAAISIYL
jgi:hypothetical protein